MWKFCDGFIFAGLKLHNCYLVLDLMFPLGTWSCYCVLAFPKICCIINMQGKKNTGGCKSQKGQ